MLANVAWPSASPGPGARCSEQVTYRGYDAPGERVDTKIRHWEVRAVEPPRLPLSAHEPSAALVAGRVELRERDADDHAARVGRILELAALRLGGRHGEEWPRLARAAGVGLGSGRGGNATPCRRQ